MYYNAKDLVETYVTQQMGDYCKPKDSCRGAFLLKDFDVHVDDHVIVSGCACSDVCFIM